MRPALRAPARTGAVARRYLRMLKYDNVVWGLVLGMLLQWGGEDGVAFGGVAGHLPLLFFLPLGQWSVAEGRALLDAAMPLGRVRHELVRVACGAAWASVTLVAALAVAYLLSRFDPGFPVPVDSTQLVQYPGWYPLALFAAGLAWYLAGAAVLLRAERPGRVLVLLAVLFPLAVALLPAGTPEGVMLVLREPAELAGMGTAEWLGGALLPVAAACAVVLAAVCLDLPRLRMPARTAARLRGALPRRAPRVPTRRPGPRRPPSAAVVAWRHAALLRHRMAWPLFVSLAVGWATARAALDAGPDGPGPALPGWYLTVAFFWPVLVWMDERGPVREQHDALPVGTTLRRVLHAGAGAAWLLLVLLPPAAGRLAGALAAGALASPADVPAQLWAGVPYGVLAFYLIGTVVTVLSEHPVRNGILVLPVVLVATTLVGYLSPLTAPFRDPPRQSWDAAGAMSWLALIAAAALAALALAVRRDRDGRFPTAGEVRSSFRAPSWTHLPSRSHR